MFNPAEVIPEFTADVGTKKGEKVDYAICTEGKVSILVECKPASSDLTINHASQLFRYFAVTDARIAILTNGVIFKFFSDIDSPNKMDAKPFFTLDLDSVKKSDVRTLSNFTKGRFNIDIIVAEAGNLKMQSLVAKELEKEFAEPSEEFIRLIAKRIHDGIITASIKDSFKSLIVASINGMIRDKVNDRLTSALHGADDEVDDVTPATVDNEDVITTQDEIDGFNIIRAIGSRNVDPSRIVMRDAKSYCAVLSITTIARPLFVSISTVQPFGISVRSPARTKRETRWKVR